MNMQVVEIVTRRKIYSQGTTVTNCISHMHLPITDRPEDCRLCQTDIRNVLGRALNANTFMNGLLDELEVVLGKEIEANNDSRR